MKIKIKSLIISTSFLLVLFCFVSADGMIQSDRDFLHDYFGNGFTSDQWDYIEGVMDNCPYFITFQTTDGTKKAVALMPYSSYYTYDDIYGSNSLTEPDLQIQITINNVGHDINLGTEYGRLCPYGLGNISSSSTDNPYCYYTFGIGQEVNAIGLCVVPSGQWYDDSSTWHCRWYYSSRRSITGFDSHAIANWTYDTSLVNCNYNARVIRGSYTITETYPQNVFPVTYSEDNRLKFSTSLRGDGEKLLNTDLSDFLRWNDEGDTQSIYNVSLTLDCDGTEFSFALDRDNSEVVFTRNMSNYTYRCVYITPYSVFDLDEYEDVTIVKCDFNRVTVNPNAIGFDEDFKIACNYPLKVNSPISDLEPEDIELPDYEDPEVVSQSQIEQIRQQLQEDSTAPNPNSGDWSFVQDHPVVSSWADHYDFRVIYSDANSFVGNQVASNVWNYYTSNNPNGLNWLTSGFVPREFLHNNSAAMFYDMIIISVYEANVALAPDNLNILQYNNIELQGYLVFYSERYYIHRQALTQQDILSVLEYESYNDILYYTYVKEKLDDFEDKTSLGFSKLIGLQGTSNSWLSTLNFKLIDTNQQLGQILAAINNIDIPEAPDLGEITDTLEYLFIPSFSWSTINYNDYLDSLGILSMPFRFGSSVFSGLENGYSPNLEYHLYEASVPLPASLGVSGNSFKLWDDQDFTLVTASIVPDQDLLANIRLFNLIICIMSQAFLTYLHIFRREGGVEDGI